MCGMRHLSAFTSKNPGQRQARLILQFSTQPSLQGQSKGRVHFLLALHIPEDTEPRGRSACAVGYGASCRSSLKSQDSRVLDLLQKWLPVSGLAQAVLNYIQVTAMF